MIDTQAMPFLADIPRHQATLYGDYEMFLGANKARIALAAMNNRLAAPELEFVLSDSEAKVLFVAQDYYDVIETILPNCSSIQTVIASKPPS